MVVSKQSDWLTQVLVLLHTAPFGFGMFLQVHVDENFSEINPVWTTFFIVMWHKYLF